MITIAIECDEASVAVAIGDDNSDPPCVQDESAETTSGRGLRLVDRIAAAWGWRPDRDATGKVVWFRLGPAQ
jgi:hypothetical protein